MRTEGGVHVFASDESKRAVVSALSFYRQRGDWKLYSFVVMANHVHLVAQETGANLSDVVCNLKKWVWGRLMPEKQGDLWERRFDDNAITHPKELANVIQYVHNNPVRIGLVRSAEGYFWSSARNLAGLKPVAMEVDVLQQ
jgi:REP element-mobilizing transposase RayT